MRPRDKYTYATDGFNGFMMRSRKSNRLATNLRNGVSSGSGKAVNFDLQGASGNMGDRIQYGSIHIEGDKGRISINNQSGEPAVWIGSLNKDE